MALGVGSGLQSWHLFVRYLGGFRQSRPRYLDETVTFTWFVGVDGRVLARLFGAKVCSGGGARI